MKNVSVKSQIINVLIKSLFVIIIFTPSIAQTAEFKCTVNKKLNSNHEYTTDEIKKWQFSVLINDTGNEALASRCDFSPSAKKVTCDKYKADKIVFDENLEIKKYYFFNSQFDVQIFSNLDFIENNGRGDIAFGKCEIQTSSDARSEISNFASEMAQCSAYYWLLSRAAERSYDEALSTSSLNTSSVAYKLSVGSKF
jgi:hypothetical protein